MVKQNLMSLIKSCMTDQWTRRDCFGVSGGSKGKELSTDWALKLLQIIR